MAPRTDHNEHIKALHRRAGNVVSQHRATALDLAADLLEMHDATGISLDSWPTACQFIEQLTPGITIEENGA